MARAHAIIVFEGQIFLSSSGVVVAVVLVVGWETDINAAHHVI